MSSWGFRPYVPVAKRRAQAEKEMVKLRKKGGVVSPIVIEGRKIAKNFWGKSWCDNLERYSDYSNRLPRGRTYVCNGSVIDLKLERGKVEALVSGSEIYKVKIDIAVAVLARWKAICADCVGSVGSLVELLQGKLSKNVMERVCREVDGLFPTPREIKMSCSCPDGAVMCKHVAATLYGVGARLDSDPGLLFALRGVDRAELVSNVANLPLTQTAATSERVLVDDDFAALFGLEMEVPAAKVEKTERGGTESVRRRSAKTAAPPPRGAAKAGDAKTKRTSGASRAPQSLAVKTPTRQKLECVAKVKPPAAAAESKRRGAGTVSAPVSISKPSVPTTAKLRRRDPQPAGRTRAAKWIGARAHKADR